MKTITRNTFPWCQICLTAGALSFGACDLKDSANKAINKATNEVAKASNSCDSFTTDSQADAENEVIRGGEPDFKFNLYWSGKKPELNMWENKVFNDHFILNFKTNKLQILDNNQALSSELNCQESPAAALTCSDRLKNTIFMIGEARKSIIERGAAISDGKNMTFKCAQEYSQKKINDLQVIISPTPVSPAQVRNPIHIKQ